MKPRPTPSLLQVHTQNSFYKETPPSPVLRIVDDTQMLFDTQMGFVKACPVGWIPTYFL